VEELQTPDTIGAPDSRIASVMTWTQDGLQPVTLPELYNAVAALEPPTSGPESLRSAFAVARNVWLYGWFHWPLFTVAEHEAYRCVEMALKQRCRADGVFQETGKDRDRANLGWMSQQAMRRGWLRDDGFAQYRRLRGEQPVAPPFKHMPGPPGPIGPVDDSDPQAFARRAMSSIRRLRNRTFHPEGHSHNWPLVGLRELEYARDILVQLFSSG